MSEPTVTHGTRQSTDIAGGDVLEYVGRDSIRVKGHRVGIEHVLAYYDDGYSTAQIAAELPGLPEAAIRAVIAVYLDHRTQIDVYLAHLAELDAKSQRAEELAGSPAVVRRLRSLKAQRQLIRA